MARQIQGAQRDFSFGEVDVALKRADDHPARKAGLRQMANARILNSGSVQNRSGRRALYPITDGGTRTERFTISAGNVFDIQFAAGRLKIINSVGVTVANFTLQGNGAALPWTANNVTGPGSPVFAILNLSIYITFAGMRPQVVTWDGMATWSIADYAELTTVNGQKRTPFYRLSPQNITMQPNAVSGAITVKFSSPIAVAGMTGTRMRFATRQILLGTVVNSTTMNATVIEPLPVAQLLGATSSTGIISIGDVVNGNGSGAQGVVTATPNQQQLFSIAPIANVNVGDTLTGGTSGATGIVILREATDVTVSLNTGTAFVAGENVTGSGGGNFTATAVSAITLVVQLVSSRVPSFTSGETVTGPTGSIVVSTITIVAPQAISVWDDEVINTFRGFPAACFVDQFRLGFCNFPAIPGGIAWSAINIPTDLYVGVLPSSAMFEIAPRKVQIYYVVPGPEGSEFVFTDRGVFYIPISETNPLKPGSVAFKLLSADGAAQVQPRLSQEAILYVNAGQNSVMAIIATGAYLRPFNTRNLTDFHAHLFNGIQAIAAPSADGPVNERYAYVLNGDRSIAVGKYRPESLPTSAPVIGWGPWSGAGTVTWIAAHAADALFTSSYFGAGIVEVLDDAQYLDCALSVNAPPAAFLPPAGQGPLWFIPGQTVTLIDQVTRAMGTYAIDGAGFIVPQGQGGENLAIASLVAGQPWTMIAEPFCPDAQSGADVGQRMDLRYIAKFAVYVVNSTGFMLAKLFNAKQTATSPALGTIMNFRRVPAYNIDDDATKAPKLRETVESWRPSGGSYDPRVAIIKDVPGPLLIAEIGIEISL